jgi:hypothetical protein
MDRDKRCSFLFPVAREPRSAPRGPVFPFVGVRQAKRRFIAPDSLKERGVAVGGDFRAKAASN